MAADALPEPHSVHPDNFQSDSLAAARQHIQTLPAREREVLLRALLEQYEHQARQSAVPEPLAVRKEEPAAREGQGIQSSSGCCSPEADQPAVPASSAPPTPPPEIYVNAATLPTANYSLGVGGPVLATAVHSASSRTPAPSIFSLSPTLVASPKTSGSSSPFISRLRSRSFSQPLTSLARQALRPQRPSASHSRSHSLPSVDMPSPRMFDRGSFLPPPPPLYTADEAAPAPAVESAPTRRAGTASTVATAVAAASGPVASPVVGASTRTTRSGTGSSTRAFWCTSCGKKYQRRADWTRHDEVCRRRRRRPAQPSRMQQRAWACGFCAAFLGSIERYHDHVALHFENGKTLAHWHHAHVIYGLLHQPGVHEAWKRLWNARMAAMPARMRTKVYWPLETEARDTQNSQNSWPTLQDSLELFDLARQSANVLATRADALAVFVTVPIDEEGSGSTESASASAPKPAPTSAAAEWNSLSIPGLTLRKSSKATAAKQPSRETLSPFSSKRADSLTANEPMQGTARSGRMLLPPTLGGGGAASRPIISSPTNFARPLPNRHTYTYYDDTVTSFGLGLLPPPARRPPQQPLLADSRAEGGNALPTTAEEIAVFSPDFPPPYP